MSTLRKGGWQTEIVGLLKLKGGALELTIETKSRGESQDGDFVTSWRNSVRAPRIDRF
jgi:hypothetical protein